MAQERKKGKKILGKEELHGKGHRVCELLNTIDSDSNNNHLQAHILPGTGLSFKDNMLHSILTRSWWNAIIKDLQRFRNLAKVIQLAKIQPQKTGLQAPFS